jgi:predicted ribosome quality control (RQC) complex YloA/Tae2 family protein
MALSPSDITDVLTEVAPAVCGGVVQKIHQPTAVTLTLDIRAPGQSFLLLISADPETTRLHVQTERLPNPPTPPAFCQLLRAHVEGARIVSLEQLQGDRIVRVTFEKRSERRLLVAELTGRSANILLLASDEKIIGALKTDRVTVGGLYAPPLSGTWITVAAIGRLKPDPGAQTFPRSEAIERESHQRETERTQHHVRQARLSDLRRSIKRTARRLEALTEDLRKLSRYQDYARYGELLKAHVGDIAKGQERITVVDYFDPALPEIVLPLDPSKSAARNLDDYFKKHRRYETAERETRPRLIATEQDLARLRRDLSALESGEMPIASTAPSPAPRRQLPASPSRAQEPGKGPFRRFVSVDGLQIFVGRNAKENEQLTFGLARSHDLWLHAQGVPGSHVVLRVDKALPVPAESLRDAATLALQYSDLRKTGKGDVIYTLRSHVRKIKSKTAGTVSVTQEKSLYLKLDPVRLRRLKDSSLQRP